MRGRFGKAFLPAWEERDRRAGASGKGHLYLRMLLRPCPRVWKEGFQGMPGEGVCGNQMIRSQKGHALFWNSSSLFFIPPLTIRFLFSCGKELPRSTPALMQKLKNETTGSFSY